MRRLAEAPVPRFALNPAEAAASLSVGIDTFNSQIRPELRVVRIGRRILIPADELQRWVDQRAEALPPGLRP